MHHMRLFRHVKAEYTCTACQRSRTVIESRISPLDLIAMACAALPVVVALVLNNAFSWWYCIIAVAAGELLALFAAGFATNVIFVFSLAGIDRCRQCNGRMFFAGRHFDPAGDRDAHSSDFVILGVFTIINALFWVAYVRGGLPW